MRNNVTIFTVSKNGKVVLVGTNLSKLLSDFNTIEIDTPHYNTLYKNFTRTNEYIYKDYCFQKFTTSTN